MKRTKSAAQARVTRAASRAAAQRKRANGDACIAARRSAAAVRLQICANVFVRSRIHFDASRGIPCRALATDSAEALAFARVDDDGGDSRSRCGVTRDEPITIH